MLNKLKRAALGAHTPHDKATAASKPVPMPLPAQVRILMSQHIGAPAKALVKKGDEVFVGTKIGEAGGFVSANIHSSVSGTVAAVEPFRLSNGRMCDSVVIKTDGKQTVDPAVKAPEVTDKASFLKAVRECGLVGLGGAGFPTDVKLQPKQQVDTLLINASECEVWLTSDTQEMLNCSDDIIRGIKAVLQYTGIPKCVIGIENNKPECIDLLCKKTNGDSTIEVKPLPSVYGTGAELILIEKCLGREVPHGGLRRRRKARHRERVEDGRSRLHGADHQQVRTAAVRLPVQPHVPAPAFAGCGHLICLPLLPSASFLAKIESYGCQRGQSQMRDCPRSISRNGV